MTFNDLKIYMLNTFAMAVSFSKLEATLKIVLLIVSIVYTFMKIIETAKGKDETKQ
jgi:hypothetical protein